MKVLHQAWAQWMVRALLVLVVIGIHAGTATPAAAATVTYTVTPAGSGIQFTTVSPYPSKWDIWIGIGAYTLGSSGPTFTNAASMRHVHSNGKLLTIFQDAFYELKPNTTYNYVIKGQNQFLTGSQKTLRRQVTVNFSKIHIIDDSDSFGAGELMFDFGTNSTWHSGLRFGEVSGSTGSFIYPKRTLTLKDGTGNYPSQWLTLMVFGRDDDCDFGLCTNGTAPSLSGGSNSEADWAAATKDKINLLEFGPENLNTLSKEFTFQTTAYALDFKAYAKVTVNYVP